VVHFLTLKGLDMSAGLFQQYITVWTNDQFAGKSAILSMDNCFIHTRPEVLMMLREHDVKVITFPPHTTQVFQALDLSLFGVLKSKVQSKLPLGNDDRVIAFIQKAFHSLKQTFVPNNVRNAFKMLGFEFNITKSPYTPLLQEEKLRGSQGVREIWDADDLLNRLSKRRREARYGWINQDE
jgi:hypothetical protein